ncbi:MAG: hypothetical protein FJ207_12860 [Gemmatimonadetes bacterium]|nr:hypothetical protein [Gemmatimonadota bacterium]
MSQYPESEVRSYSEVAGSAGASSLLLGATANVPLGARVRSGMRIGSKMRTAIAVAALLAAAAVSPRVASAQVTPSDSAAVLLDAAQGFETDGRAAVAAAIYQLVLDRYPSTPAAAEARARLAAAPLEATSRSGSVELRVWMTIYGAWLGVGVPGAFGADSSEPYGVGLLLGGPTGFLAGHALANALDLTEGQARAITLGGTWGTWQGYGWREVFDLGVAQDCQFPPFCYDAESDTEETFAALVGGGLAGIALGTVLSQREMSAGTASAVNFASLWGTWFGVAGGVLMDLEGDDLLAATLVGGDAALLAAALLAPRWGVTRSRARLVSIAGVLGGLAGAGIDLLAKPDDEKVAIGIPLATSVVGLAVGATATRRGDETAQGPPIAPDGALVRFDDGRLAFGMPVPVPTFVPTPNPSPASGRIRDAWRPALALELFRASF